jgi:O-antigen biosynthesis protein WbqP
MDVRCFFLTIKSVFKGSGVVEGGTGTIEKERKNTN